jgi:flagellar biosynthesis GTPase FlhF
LDEEYLLPEDADLLGELAAASDLEEEDNEMAILEDRSVKYEVLHPKGGYVDPSTTVDIADYLSPFAAMLAAMGMEDGGFSGPIMTAWLDGGGDETVEPKSDATREADFDLFLSDAWSIADTDTYYTDNSDDGSTDIADVAAENDSCWDAFSPGSPTTTPPPSPTTTRVRHRRARELARLQEMAKKKAEAEKKAEEKRAQMRVQLAADAALQKQKEEKLQAEEDAKEAAKAEVHEKELAATKAKFTQRQNLAASQKRDAQAAAEQAATEKTRAAAEARTIADKHAKEAERAQMLAERTASREGKTFNKPTRRELKAAAAAKESATSQNKNATRVQIPSGAGKPFDTPASDSDDDATPQFLTRQRAPPKAQKMSAQMMELSNAPKKSGFQKREPLKPDEDDGAPSFHDAGKAVIATTTAAIAHATPPAAAVASTTTTNAETQEAGADDAKKKKKKKKKPDLSTMTLGNKHVQAAEKLAAQAEAARQQAVVDTGAAAMAMVVEQAMHAQRQEEEEAARVREAALYATEMLANLVAGTPERGTLHIKREMPTKTVRTMTFATRGMPGQGPKPPPMLFPAPAGHEYGGNTWQTDKYDEFARKQQKKERRRAIAQARREQKDTDTIRKSQSLQKWPQSTTTTSTTRTDSPAAAGAAATQPRRSSLQEGSPLLGHPRPQSAHAAVSYHSPHERYGGSGGAGGAQTPTYNPPAVDSPRHGQGFLSRPQSGARYRELSETVPMTSVFMLRQQSTPIMSPAPSPRLLRRRSIATPAPTEDALRRSMGLGKGEDLLDALLNANTSPASSVASPDRPSARFRHLQPRIRPFSAGGKLNNPTDNTQSAF